MSTRTSKRKSTPADDVKDASGKKRKETPKQAGCGHSHAEHNGDTIRLPGQIKLTEEARYPPLAIVGMGCRFPGDVNTVDDFIKVFEDGRYVIGDVPPDRWDIDKYWHPDPTNIGTHANRKAGFLRNVHDFDNGFFNISPREAGNMDTQQRHIMEVAQEALDDAGIPTETLPKDRTGVYIGIGLMDHGFTVIEDAKCMNAYTHTGTAHSVTANRINYAYDLRGPSVAIDTACAASLTATHYACYGLWNKECDIAIVGGCNTLMVPEVTVGFNALGVLAPDSMSCPFSDQAKGYVRSEGTGVVILKTLEDALRDNDQVYCTIRASVVAHNGYSLSITMPSTDAQKECMDNLYKHFGLPMEMIDFVEAHGTGTPVGDPIEAEAIYKTFCRDSPARKEKPLLVGSSKSHFGHLECAAGMAQIMKAACMLQNRMIFPNIHYGNPNPKIEPENWGIHIPEKMVPFIEDKNMMIGINTFGFGGSLAHCVFEEFIKPEGYDTRIRKGTAGWKFGPSETAGLLLPIPLSAKSTAALKAHCELWANYENNDLDAMNITCWKASRRSHYSKRMLVLANSGADFRQKMKMVMDKQSSENIIEGSLSHGAQQPKICFLFPGQGQQSFEMGRSLYRDEPVFRDVVDRCDAIYKRLSGESFCKTFHLFHPLKAGEGDKEITNQIHVSQPAILFLQLGLYHLLEHWGIKPDMVVGHSLGEVASAYASGAMNLEEAVTVQYYRAQSQAKLQGTGAMAAMRLSEKDGKEFCKRYDDLYVACINGPESITVAGAPDVVKRVCDENPNLAKQVRVRCAFHTIHMEPLKKDFLKSMKGKLRNGRPETCPMYSTVTGGLYEVPVDAKYCWDNIRENVDFNGAVSAIFRDHGEVLFIELAGAQTLLSSIRQIARVANVQPSGMINLGQRKQDDRVAVLRALGAMYGLGINIDWAKVTGDCATYCKIPAYAWQHQTFRYEAEGMRNRRLNLEDRTYKGLHGLIQLDQLPFLRDHLINFDLYFPRSGYVEYILQSSFSEEQLPAIRDVSFDKKELAIPSDYDLGGEVPERKTLVQVVNKNTIEVRCQNDGETYACATVMRDNDIPFRKALDIQKIKQRCTRRVDATDFYGRMEPLGLTYEQNFKVVEECYFGDGEALSIMTPPMDKRQRIQTVHLDSAFLTAISAKLPLGTTLFAPSKIESLQMHVPYIPIKETLLVYVNLLDVDSTKLICDMYFMDEHGMVLAEVKGFEARNEQDLSSNQDLTQCVYETYWECPKAKLPSTNMWQKISTQEYLIEHHKEEILAVNRAESHLDSVKQICGAYSRFAVNTVPKDKRSSRIERYINRLENIAKETPEKISYEDIGRLSEDIKKSCPEFALEVDLCQRLGEVLHETMSDPAVALKVLFQPENMHAYFVDSITTRIYYKMLADGVAMAVAEATKRKKVVRVMEVGGRMGALAKYICSAIRPYLENGSVEYIFTDINVAFFNEVKEHALGEFPNIRYQQFDVEKDSNEQAFVPGTIDIIVCMDTLHCTEHSEHSTKIMRDVLAEDGWLVVMESTNNHNTPEIIFGAFDLCWVYKDERGDRCWQSQDAWCNTLRKSGFSDVLAVSTPNEFFHSFIIGRKTETSLFYPEFQKMKAAEEALKASENEEEAMDVDPVKDEPLDPTWYLVHLDDPSIAKELKKLLKRDVHLVTVKEFESLADSLIEKPTPLNIVYFWNEGDADLSSLLMVVKSCQGMGEKGNSSLFVATAKTNACSDLDSSVVSGFMRVACNEVNNMQVYHIDIEPSGKTTMAKDIFHVLNNHSHAAHEMAVRGGSLVVPRVLRKPLETKKVPTKHEWRIEALNEDDTYLDSLDFHETSDVMPGRNQIKVRVLAVGLSALDAKKVAEKKSLDTLGQECAGVIQSLGRDVTGYSVGDEVIAFGDKMLSSHVICNPHNIVKKPATISNVEAAASGLAYGTAYYAVIERANLRREETILIHSAANPTGLGAIQLAGYRGANVIVTAENDEERNFLKRHSGVTHVTNCKTFHKDVMNWTRGNGVDVALTWKNGSVMEECTKCLAVGGRICMINETGEHNASHLSKAISEKNITFMAIDMEVLLKNAPGKFHAIWENVVALLDAGQVSAIPNTHTPVSDFKHSVMTLLENGTMGKHVLEVKKGFQPGLIEPALNLFNPKATYIITGGHGSVGREMARWMSDRGAKNIALVSKRGSRHWDQEATISHLKERGTRVYDLRADLSVEKDVRRLFQSLTNNDTPAIKGIFHLSALNEDCSLSTITEESLQLTLQAKAYSARLLDQVTRELELNLDYFVMFSSSATIWGHPNLSAYCAACSYLDALAQERRTLNLPAVSLQVGWLRGAGWVEAKGKEATLLEKGRPRTMHVRELFDMMHKVLPKTDLPAVVALTNEDWDAAADFSAKDCARFWSFTSPGPRTSAGANMTKDDLEGKVVEKLAGLLMMALEDIDPALPMIHYGVDSLVSLDIVNWMRKSFNIQINQMDILEGMSTASLVDQVLAS